MKRILLFLGVCLMLSQALWATTVILDSSDTQDWVRIMSQNYPKYKDTMIRPTALLKFETDDIPKTAKIESAILYYKRVITESGATITVSYAKDDSWSFDRTDAEDLFNWPVDETLGIYATGG